MVGTLWQKCMPNADTYYPPYEHQYQCWKTLLKEKTPDGKNMSIVVTTGTGSGKTECFMLPPCTGPDRTSYTRTGAGYLPLPS